jgi:hypothetical protein
VPPGYAPSSAVPAGYPAAPVPPGYAQQGYTPVGYAPPGYVPPGYPPIAPAPRRKRRTGLFIGIGVVVLALCAGLGVAAYVVGKKVDHTIATGTGSSTASSTSPSSKPSGPPDATTVNGSLRLQSAALVAGDEAGWMAAVDPAKPAAVAEYQRIFHNLHAMKIASLDQNSVGGDDAATTTLDAYDITLNYCLVQAPCQKNTATLHTTAMLVGGRAVIESISTPAADPDSESPYPWLVANLSVAVGQRVVVAASSSESSHLQAALSDAEQAATVADKYAHWARPDVYVVYLASVKEAGTWFGGLEDAKNYLSMMNPVSITDLESVLIMPNASLYGGPGGLLESMQWALGDVALSYGTSPDGDNSLTYGLHTYVSVDGHPSWGDLGSSDVRTFIHSGKWNKSVYLTSELGSSSQSTRWAAEGIGYYAIKRMVQKYGLDKTLTFWGDLARSGDAIDTASRQAFGVPWSTVNADCVAYVKSVA